jgi:endonuclease-3
MDISYLLKELHSHYSTMTQLRFSSLHELLFSVIMSAQTTDAQVNKVTKNLFKKYKTLEDFANADINELQKDISSIGIFRNKAKNIKASANKIINEFNSVVPGTMNKLLTLPGVGRKTANVVLTYGFGKSEGIAVDTHVKRISKRLGLTEHTNPIKIEQNLMKLLPKKEWSFFTHLIVEHGRALCKAPTPNCKDCFLNQTCPSSRVKNNT